MSAHCEEWHISNAAIYKLLATAAVCVMIFKLAPLLILIALAVLVAVTMTPVITLLERRMPHAAASSIVSLGVILILVGFVLVIIPSLTEQFSEVIKNLPESQNAILEKMPAGQSRQFARRLLQAPAISAQHILSAGSLIFAAVSEFVLMIALALYLASDGKRTYVWVRAFFSPAHRQKLDKTAEEAADIITSYVAGQLITSVLCAGFVFAVLTWLNVPAALVLAVIAGVFDILPMVGFFLFTIPAVLFALTVSSQAALTVLACYVGYHLIENYVIVPKVYGNRLRLSDLVVLTAVLAGALLGGIPGAILILPLVAVYPAVERIWLVEYVGREAVDKHETVEASPAK